MANTRTDRDSFSSRSGMSSSSTSGKLIASSRVEGTNVYNRQGESLGEIHDLMIDKKSGHVAYAIMSFGGFLGMGESYHPLPWSVLDYSESQGGYVVDIDKDRLKGAPYYSADETPDWTGNYGREIDDYYGVTPRAF
jgi:sporulation protein YlmC with PRC-barrel domain